MRWLRHVTRSRFLDALATVICLVEILFLGGRPWVLGFAAALFGLKFTLPIDSRRRDDEEK
jgi:hypothetical protein